MTYRFKAIALAYLGFFLYAIVDVTGKSLAHQMSAFEFTFWFSIPALLSLMVLSPWLGGLKTTLRTTKMKWHLLRAVLTAFIPALNFYALAHMSLVNFYTIVFTAPFFTALLSIPFLKEKVPVSNFILICVGFAGVLLAMRPDINDIGWPEIAVLVTAFTFAFRNLIVPKMGKQETLLSYGLYSYLAIMLASAGPVLMDFELPDLHTAALLCIGGISGGIGIVVGSVAFRMAPPSLVASTHYSQILWGLIFGVALFHDYPDIWDLSGAAIVSGCGLALIWISRTKKHHIVTHAKNPPLPPGT